MRNDAHDDFDDVPSLSARQGDDDDDLVPAAALRDRNSVTSRTAPVVKVKAPASGPLWALVVALFIALGGLGWWSFQQISLMEQQLVATQESFARISEDAAGRLQAITGKVAATENLSSTDSEAMKLQLKTLQTRMDEQTRQQAGVGTQQSSLDKRLDQVLAQAANQQASNDQVQAQLKSLAADMSSLKAAQGDQARLSADLKSLSTDVAALKKQGNNNDRLSSIEQDLIVLKSEQDNRPAAAAQAGPSTAEFDSFRGQTTRNITTLQSQMQNLQQQINARQ
ncbi:ATPase [Pseudomonas sp. MWU16-30317]|uniref:ATPase n=1 Tax=Pseudomonas sp. MWU16-30317 TaxID=2878095 RepID=UPI001CF978B2|nr:ATPase [Pseudomonas sp. MWU16-30317]